MKAEPRDGRARAGGLPPAAPPHALPAHHRRDADRPAAHRVCSTGSRSGPGRRSCWCPASARPMFSLATLSYHTRGMAADIRIPGHDAAHGARSRRVDGREGDRLLPGVRLRSRRRARPADDLDRLRARSPGHRRGRARPPARRAGRPRPRTRRRALWRRLSVASSRAPPVPARVAARGRQSAQVHAARRSRRASRANAVGSRATLLRAQRRHVLAGSMAGVAVAAQGVTEAFRRLDQIPGELRGHAIQVGLQRVVGQSLGRRLARRSRGEIGARAEPASRAARDRRRARRSRSKRRPGPRRAHRRRPPPAPPGRPAAWSPDPPDVVRREARPRGRDRGRPPPSPRRTSASPPPPAAGPAPTEPAAWSMAPSCASSRAARASRRGSSGTACAAASASARAAALFPARRSRSARASRHAVSIAGGRHFPAQIARALRRALRDRARPARPRPSGAGRGDRRASRTARRPAARRRGPRCRGRGRAPPAPPGKPETMARRRSPRRTPARPLEIAAQRSDPAERIQRVRAPGLGRRRGGGDARGALAVTVSGGQQRLGAGGQRRRAVRPAHPAAGTARGSPPPPGRSSPRNRSPAGRRHRPARPLQPARLRRRAPAAAPPPGLTRGRRCRHGRARRPARH